MNSIGQSKLICSLKYERYKNLKEGEEVIFNIVEGKKGLQVGTVIRYVDARQLQGAGS